MTNDSYGLYPIEIARKIKASPNSSNNRMVNLFSNSVHKDSIITYIPETNAAFKKYIFELPQLDKIIFHPYTISSYRFLKIALKKFPKAKVYWMCWSSELYNPQLIDNLYEPYSATYIRKRNLSAKHLKNIFRDVIYKIFASTGIIKDQKTRFQKSCLLVDYFCSPFYSDFLFLQKITNNSKIQYLSVAYLSLNNIMPRMDAFTTSGYKIMIGHSATPELNHYEIIQKISGFNRNYSVLLPLSYGDKQYGNLIKSEAQKVFKNIEVLEKKLDRDAYYEKLTEVGWAVINSKVQQGVGNIIALLWMGCKIFLEKNTSTYKDFLAWGIHIYTINEHLNVFELSNKLSPEQINNNRKKIMAKFNENTVNKGWNEFLY